MTTSELMALPDDLLRACCGYLDVQSTARCAQVSQACRLLVLAKMALAKRTAGCTVAVLMHGASSSRWPAQRSLTRTSTCTRRLMPPRGCS